MRSETLFFEVSMTTSMSSWHCRFDTALLKLRTCSHTLSQTTALEGHFCLRGHFPSNSGKKKGTVATCPTVAPTNQRLYKKRHRKALAKRNDLHGSLYLSSIHWHMSHYSHRRPRKMDSVRLPLEKGQVHDLLPHAMHGHLRVGASDDWPTL